MIVDRALILLCIVVSAVHFYVFFCCHFYVIVAAYRHKDVYKLHFVHIYNNEGICEHIPYRPRSALPCDTVVRLTSYFAPCGHRELSMVLLE